MKKKIEIEINEGVSEKEVSLEHSTAAPAAKKSKANAKPDETSENSAKPLKIADDSANHKPQNKAEFKAQLKESKMFYRNIKRLLKKAKKAFKKSSKKADEQQYQIAKFNFSEAKTRKKDQKQQLKVLKKMRKLFKKPKAAAKK